jgi:hypothetical protein
MSGPSPIFPWRPSRLGGFSADPGQPPAVVLAPRTRSVAWLGPSYRETLFAPRMRASLNREAFGPIASSIDPVEVARGA